MGFFLVRNRFWFSGSNEKDIGFGIDVVGDDEREDKDVEVYY